MKKTAALWTSRILGTALAISLPLALGWIVIQWMLLSTRLAVAADEAVDPVRFLVAIVTPTIVGVGVLFLAWRWMRKISDELNPTEWR